MSRGRDGPPPGEGSGTEEQVTGFGSTRIVTKYRRGSEGRCSEGMRILRCIDIWGRSSWNISHLKGLWRKRAGNSGSCSPRGSRSQSAHTRGRGALQGLLLALGGDVPSLRRGSPEHFLLLQTILCLLPFPRAQPRQSPTQRWSHILPRKDAGLQSHHGHFFAPAWLPARKTTHPAASHSFTISSIPGLSLTSTAEFTLPSGGRW